MNLLMHDMEKVRDGESTDILGFEMELSVVMIEATGNRNRNCNCNCNCKGGGFASIAAYCRALIIFPCAKFVLKRSQRDPRPAMPL